ncbi:MAG: IS4 family transposase [Betaproteobacteria bacterium]|nr:IS4 family transposase [Betaproteobacteria bacterium]
MFRISRFQEIMKGLPRGAFDRIVEQHQADKYSKKFRCWDQMLTMVYGQLSGAGSLRQLETGFNSHIAHHYHLGTSCIKRSTLADANNRRKEAVFADTAQLLMGQMSRQIRKQVKQLLYLLDSTSITLKGEKFDPWTGENRTRNTQGIKLHVLLASEPQAPVWHDFSAANVNDVEKTDAVPLHKDALYVFDKGYCDYNWWHRIDAAGAQFVTRFKRNAGLRVEQELPIPAEAATCVLQDRIVRFRNKRPRGGCVNLYDKPLRYISIARCDKPTPLVLATNDLYSPALEIARRYRDRWQIELFFKWIKQHLKIKQFLGCSENAVRIQILTALISYLLVVLYKQAHHLKKSLWECLCLIRATLFQRPDIEISMYRRRRSQLEQLAQAQRGLFS